MTCPICDSECRPVPESEVLPSAWAVEGNWIIQCQGCNAYAACMAGTQCPVESMGTGKDHTARSKAKAAWEALWRRHGGKGMMSRASAERWLCEKMGREDCRIDWLNAEECAEVVKHCQQMVIYL